MQEKSPKECAIIAAAAANDKKASDIIVLQLSEIVSICDYFVIASASNLRQIEAVVDEIEEKLREHGGIKPINRECGKDDTWSLLDYGEIVIHVFDEPTREYYKLEELWNMAPVLDLEKEGIKDLEYSKRLQAFISD